MAREEFLSGPSWHSQTEQPAIEGETEYNAALQAEGFGVPAKELLPNLQPEKKHQTPTQVRAGNWENPYTDL